ncbi:MAG: hypothetical protein HOL15_00430 [Nitrospinaceae bacterium]|nr:hypothetical protein [Nitrospinaceae bacterium]
MYLNAPAVKPSKNTSPRPRPPWGFPICQNACIAKKIQTFSFVREGNRKEDWYANTLLQIKKKRQAQQSKAKRKNKKLGEVAS